MPTLTTPSIPAALGLSPRTRAALLMLAASAALAGTLASVRQLPSINPAEIAFFRYLFGVMLFLPWLMREGTFLPATNRIGRHVFRAATGLAGMTCLFFAARMMPLAEATSLSFTAPLFAVLGGALVLREHVSRHRWLCTALGFLGALIVLRPGAGTISPGALVALTGAVFIAMATLSAKTLARTEATTTIVFYFTMLVTPLSFVIALPVWTTPGLADLPWLVLIAVLATASQMLLTQALREADASFVLPFDYSQLVFSALLGLVIYAEIPSVLALIGSAVIVGAALLSVLEDRISRPARSAPARPHGMSGAAAHSERASRGWGPRPS
jgi:drug/metabolite transporter (DMT)-like permease